MPRPSFVRGRCGAILLACLVVAGVVALTPVRGVVATGWEPTGLAERAWGLGAPTSGAFFASTESGVYRSDDGGASWRPVPLPPAYGGDASRRRVVVDPSDHTRMFVDGWVTRDDGAIWNPLGSWAVEPDDRVRLVVRPADPNLLYLSLTRGGMGTGRVRMLRSRDGGGSWEEILVLGPQHFRPSSVITVTLFAAHPSDPNVLFQSVTGFTSRNNQGVLRRSADQGDTLQEVLFSPSRYPSLLVGGRGVSPGRFYCALGSMDASRELYRSDDDGVTWTRVASYEAEGEWVGSLDYDPSAPDRVYVVVGTSGVKSSDDGGRTWTDLGLADQKVNGVALGVNGRNLYAATDRGVFRLPLR